LDVILDCSEPSGGFFSFFLSFFFFFFFFLLRGFDQLRRLLVDGDAKVQEKSIVLMVYLAKSEENRSPLRESGCLEVLCSKLDSPRSVILHNCMAALVNAVIGNTKNQNAIRDNGSIKKIVTLMMDEKSPKVTI
jgi:hypothetical protein